MKNDSEGSFQPSCQGACLQSLCSSDPQPFFLYFLLPTQPRHILFKERKSVMIEQIIDSYMRLSHNFFPKTVCICWLPQNDPIFRGWHAKITTKCKLFTIFSFAKLSTYIHTSPGPGTSKSFAKGPMARGIPISMVERPLPEWVVLYPPILV